MANFSISNSTAMGGGNTQQGSSTSYKTLIAVGNSSATTTNAGFAGNRRGKLYDIIIGTAGTPADNYYEFDVTTITLGTTPSGIVNTLISSLSSTFGEDPSDTTFAAAIQINSTSEVGISALTEKWYLGMNQRASYRWVCAPGSEILYPANSSATGLNGLALRGRSGGGTVNMTGTVMVSEQ
jgi:hypothetical protein